MKLKQSKGMSLIVFTIILAVLVVVAGGVIVYLLNNPVKENVAIQNQTGTQTNTDNNQNKVNTNVSNVENNKLLELSKVSLDRYIYNLNVIAKFDDISKANLEDIVNYSLNDANYAYYNDNDGWNLISDNKDDIISEVAKRFDISNSTIENKIKNMKIDPEYVGMYNYQEGGDAYTIEKTYSKIQDIKYIGNNKYEVKAIQFDLQILCNDFKDVTRGIETITIVSEGMSKEIYSEIRKSTKNEEAKNYKNYISDILNYVKTNNVGNKIFTIEVNDNYSINSAEEYDNNNYFRLISIK